MTEYLIWAIMNIALFGSIYLFYLGLSKLIWWQIVNYNKIVSMVQYKYK